jgi:hypothetical protein
MTARDWILQFALGGTFGALGQSLRIVVGLKKLHDQALQAGRTFGQVFSPGTLMVSLLVGVVAGVLGTLTETIDLEAVTRENVLVLVGIGYAGADFIEGFMKKRLPPLAADPASGGPPAQERSARAAPELAPRAAPAEPPRPAAPPRAAPPDPVEDDREPPPVG